MRNLDEYDIIFCDIDDTLVYGFWTELMKHTWNIFRSNKLSDILMTLQFHFRLYKVNQKLKFMLENTSTPIIFLTARKYNKDTEYMLADILQDTIFDVEHLATDDPAADKYNQVVSYIHSFLDMGVELKKICVFDDNEDVRKLISTLEADVFDPIPMRELVR